MRLVVATVAMLVLGLGAPSVAEAWFLLAAPAGSGLHS